MSRRVALLLSLAGLLAVGPSTGHGAEQPAAPGGAPVTDTIPGLAGSWKMTHLLVSSEAGPVDLIPLGGALWFTFDEGGRFVLTRKQSGESSRVAETGDWKPVSPESIEMDGDGPAPPDVYGVSVAGDLLLMSGHLTVDLDEDGVAERAAFEGELHREADKLAEGSGIAGAWVRSGGRVRTYRLHVPAAADGGEPPALVLAFHGGGDSGASMQWFSGLDVVADELGALVAYPDALDGQWAIGCGCTPADRSGIQDVVFVERVIDQLSAAYRIDSSRVFAAGFSQGGMLVSRLACEVPHRVAAVATIGGGLTRVMADSCAPSRPVPIVAFHGTADASVPYLGNTTVLPVQATLDLWARIDGCGGAVDEPLPDTRDDGTQVTRTRYSGCAAGSEAVLYTVEGGGHTWPGSPVSFDPSLGLVTYDIDASRIALEFFSRHALRD